MPGGTEGGICKESGSGCGLVREWRVCVEASR